MKELEMLIYLIHIYGCLINYYYKHIEKYKIRKYQSDIDSTAWNIVKWVHLDRKVDFFLKTAAWKLLPFEKSNPLKLYFFCFFFCNLLFVCPLSQKYVKSRVFLSSITPRRSLLKSLSLWFTRFHHLKVHFHLECTI